MKSNYLVIPALIIAVAALIATTIVAITFKNIKSENQSINTTGSARKVIVSDLGVLNGSLSSTAGSPSEAYQELRRQSPFLINYLKEKGFEESKIEFKTISQYPNYSYNQNGQQMGIMSYTATQMISITSSDVNKIRETSVDISSLIEKGVNFVVFTPEYYYTKIGDIKIEIQAEAAKDAMTRGERIAEATGRKLGALRRARMGVIQITPENSNMVSDQGINDVSSIRKEITAVVNADFSIE